MLNRLSHTQLLRYAGLFTWAVVGIPLIVLTWHFPASEALDAGESPRLSGLSVASVAYLAFGAIYWQVTRALGTRTSRLADIALLAALSRRTDLSVGCYCEDERRCHRSLLRALLAEEGATVV